MKILQETLKVFVEWTKLKVRLHIKEEDISFKPREIWWASLGANIGYEQDGKNENFERPVLVLKKFGRFVLWGIPMTSKIKDNKYHQSITYYAYDKDQKGNLISEEKEGRIILNQLRVMSSKRLIRKVGVTKNVEFDYVRDQIKNMI